MEVTKKSRKGTKKGENSGNNQQGVIFVPTIAALPDVILLEILLLLSVSDVLICKQVCKKWLRLISSRYFAKLHCEKSLVTTKSLLLRAHEPIGASRFVYYLEVEHHEYKEYLAGHNSNVKNEPPILRLKLPIRDSYYLEERKYGMQCSSSTTPKDHCLEIGSSCRGLLCLCDSMSKEPILVCNPLTGEYLRLPRRKRKVNGGVDSALGYNSRTEEFKLIKFSYCRKELKTIAEILTLGVNSWRSLEGCVYWLQTMDSGPKILFFDVENETYQEFDTPPYGPDTYDAYSDRAVNMGVLKDKLYVSYAAFNYRKLEIWVMEKFPDKVSWKKFLVANDTEECKKFCYLQPLKILKDGAMLMYCETGILVLHINERKKYYYYRGKSLCREKFDASAYTPSFISLKDSLASGNIHVLNTKSRCRTYKPHEEGVEKVTLSDVDDIMMTVRDFRILKDEGQTIINQEVNV